MWFVIILIVLIIIAVVVKKSYDKTKAEQLEKERIEQQRKAAAAEKAKFEVITDLEKQKMLECGGEENLNVILAAFDKAVHGDGLAMVLVGVQYTMLKNPTKAVYWFKKAANIGYPDGIYWYGNALLEGYGVEEDRITGMSKIIDAARRGSKEAIQACLDSGMSRQEMRAVGIQV